MLACAGCGAVIEPSALSCPACHKLTRSEQLESLAAQARDATARGDLVAARTLWEQCAAILPSDTVQYQSIQARIQELNTRIAESHPPHTGQWGKRLGSLGVFGIFLWKFKTILLLVLTKGKLLLLGFTKIGTLLSMVAWVGVYWAVYGWWFALGSVFSIYVHEMGHVIELRRYGIAASAPMFIPGIGAFISLRQLSITPVQDSRVGLAGPIYGFGAALVALGGYYLTGSKAWAAIAHFGAVINLFNLIPVWQLDGSRGLRSASKQQRLAILAVAAVLWMITSEGILFLIALAAVFRLFTKDAPQEPDRTALMQYAGLLVALSTLSVLAQQAAR